MFLFVANNPIVYRLLFSMTINRNFIHFCVPSFRCKLLEDNWKRKLPFERVSSLLTNPILGIGTKLIIQSSHQRSSLTSNVLTFQLFAMSVLMAHASFWLIAVEIGIDSGYQKFKWFADINLQVSRMADSRETKKVQMSKFRPNMNFVRVSVLFRFRRYILNLHDFAEKIRLYKWEIS